MCSLHNRIMSDIKQCFVVSFVLSATPQTGETAKVYREIKQQLLFASFHN